MKCPFDESHSVCHQQLLLQGCFRLTLPPAFVIWSIGWSSPSTHNWPMRGRRSGWCSRWIYDCRSRSSRLGSDKFKHESDKSKALQEFPRWIDFSLLHILKVTLISKLCHVAQSLFNPRCACTTVGHVVIRLTGMRTHFGGFVITCLLICEYLFTLCAKSGGHRLVAKILSYDLEDLCCLLS